MFVGIEITSRSVRAVRRAGRRPGAGDCTAERTLPPGEGGVPAQAIRELLDGLGASDATVGVAVPSAWCHFRTVCFPYRRAGRVERTAAYALEGRIPGPVESFVIEPAGPLRAAGENGSRLLVAACARDRIKALLDALDAAGVSAALVQPALMASSAAFGRSSDGALALRVDERIEGAILRGGGVVAAILGDVEGAEGGRSPEAVGERVERAVRLYELADGSEEFDRVALSAEGEDAEVLAREIERRLGRRVERAGAPEARWAAATGMAAQCAGAAHLAPTLRRGEFAYRPHARRGEVKAAAALALAAAIAATAAVGGARAVSAAQAERAALEARQRAAFAETTGLTNARPTFIQMEAALKQARESARRGPGGSGVSALLRWADLMRLAPDGASVRFDSIDISPRRLIFAARVQNTATAERLRAGVEGSSRFAVNGYHLSVKAEGGSTFYVLEMELGYKR